MPAALHSLIKSEASGPSFLTPGLLPSGCWGPQVRACKGLAGVPPAGEWGTCYQPGEVGGPAGGPRGGGAQWVETLSRAFSKPADRGRAVL